MSLSAGLRGLRENVFGRSRGLSAAITVFALVGYVAALLRERATAGAYGAGRDLDAFVVANTAVGVIALTLGRALYDPLVVTLASARARDLSAARALTRVAILGMAVALLAGALLLALLRAPLVAAIAPATQSDTLAESARLALYLAPSVVLLGLGEIARAALHGHQEFVVSSVVPIANTLVVLACVVLLAPSRGIEALVLGTILGGTLQLALALGALTRSRAINVTGAGANPNDVRALLAPFGAGLALTALSSLLIVVDRALASALPEGRIAALNYAARLLEVATILASTGVATVAYPLLARLRAGARHAEFARVFRLSLVGTLLIAVPGALVLAVFAAPVVTVLLGTGRFDEIAQRITGESLAAYSLALPFLAAGSVLARTLYALRRIRLLIMQGVLFLLVKVAVGLALVGLLQHVGVALSTGVAAAVATAFVLVDLVRWTRSVGGPGADLPIGPPLNETR